MSINLVTDRLFLVGLSGGGKSSVAQAVATKLGWTTHDSDMEIAAQDGRSIKRIFAEDGEDAFRTIEHDVLVRLSGHSRSVIAVGGGAMAEATTRKHLLRHGLVAWLQVSPSVAAARLRTRLALEPRPMLGSNPEQSLSDLMRARESAYCKAHIYIQTDRKSIEEVAASLVTELHTAQLCQPV